MKKLFEKNEVTFAVVLIVIYVVGSSLMASVSEAVGIDYLGEALFHTVMGAVLLVFIKSNDLMTHIGLCRPEVPAVKLGYYLPLAVILLLPFCFGIGSEIGMPALLFRTLSMLFVGFIEEVIFRGFLFKGICKQNVTRAIIISAVTFGIGHIVNLLNGYTNLDTIIQIIFAVCVGFVLVYLFHKTGSLLACIAFHSLNNTLSAFTSYTAADHAMLIATSIRLVLMVICTLYLIKMLPERES